MEVDGDSEISIDAPPATPLLTPKGGTPALIATELDLANALDLLSRGSGPFAIDAERASGYKYSQRAYLIQIKRTKGGLHLIDPIAFSHPHPLFARLNELIQSDEVILHASTQDLPCLREIGLNPERLFDTELGGRLAGLSRVGLGPLIETQLGFSLAKEHSAVDWSTRPLPHDWLTYAALDVELLIELREKIAQLLLERKKLHWAEEEFAAILAQLPSAPRKDPWRRTSGMHKIKKQHQLAIIEALWNARDEIAREADIAPGKLLTDNAICELAIGAPVDRKSFEKTLHPLGMRARWLENAPLWLSSIALAISTPESAWPQLRPPSEALPPIKIWRDKFPIKFAHLSHARAGIDALAELNALPPENLITPEFVRRICWHEPKDVSLALKDLGARQWQIDIVSHTLSAALMEGEPLAISVDEEEPAL